AGGAMASMPVRGRGAGAAVLSDAPPRRTLRVPGSPAGRTHVPTRAPAPPVPPMISSRIRLCRDAGRARERARVACVRSARATAVLALVLAASAPRLGAQDGPAGVPRFDLGRGPLALEGPARP